MSRMMSRPPEEKREELDLPPPGLRGGMPLAEALAHRRSHREFAARRPTPAQVAQLCWAAQGITAGAEGFRTAPSAGATYPITLLVVEPGGVFCYDPAGHRLRRVLTGDVRTRLQAAAEDQSCVGAAPLCLAFAVEPARVAARYGRRRGWRYALLEAGHAAQNVPLQATALGLVGVPVGAFEDRQVADILGLPSGLHPVYLLSLGVPIDS
jgi:SagB-type dehydrogenase family enzyme